MFKVEKYAEDFKINDKKYMNIKWVCVGQNSLGRYMKSPQ